MSLQDFTLLLITTYLTMIACRVIPLFVVKKKGLPPRLERALKLIPSAAFAALVANDVLKPGMFSGDVLQNLVPVIASLAVVVVALKTKSLLICTIVGCLSFALVAFAVGMPV